MKALVIYDSFFGNTEKIAQTIGTALGSLKDVSVCRVSEADQEQLKGLEFLFVGSPTRAFSPTPAIKSFVNRLPGKSLDGVNVTSFDTRIRIDEKMPGILRFLAGIFGYADKPILNGLLKKGGIQGLASEGFIVLGSEGPLADGELERAAEWAKGIFKP